MPFSSLVLHFVPGCREDRMFKIKSVVMMWVFLLKKKYDQHAFMLGIPDHD
jgi:hypothetical protein